MSTAARRALCSHFASSARFRCVYTESICHACNIESCGLIDTSLVGVLFPAVIERVSKTRHGRLAKLVNVRLLVLSGTCATCCFGVMLLRGDVGD